MSQGNGLEEKYYSLVKVVFKAHFVPRMSHVFQWLDGFTPRRGMSEMSVLRLVNQET